MKPRTNLTKSLGMPAAPRPRADREETRARLRNQRGQTLGAKGMRTRQRIIDAMMTLIRERQLRELGAAEIARVADVSIASFYSYFRDVPEVAIAAAEQVSATAPDLSDLLTIPWADAAALSRIRTMIERLVDYNVAHYEIIHLRNNLADEGDKRFAVIRSRQARPIVELLSRQIATGGTLGQLKAVDALVAEAPASLLYGMVERIVTLLVQQPYSYRPARRDELVDAAARIIHSVTHGGPAAVT